MNEQYMDQARRSWEYKEKKAVSPGKNGLKMGGKG